MDKILGERDDTDCSCFSEVDECRGSFAEGVALELDAADLNETLFGVAVEEENSDVALSSIGGAATPVTIIIIIVIVVMRIDIVIVAVSRIISVSSGVEGT